MMTKSTYLINKQLHSLIKEETNIVANLSNASALLNEFLENINWVGFYLWDDNDKELILGPFQGKVACLRIENGKGVCGTAFKTNETTVVDNVHEFPGHIACDSASQSEIVIPLRSQSEDKIVGVLDIDSPILNRFSDNDTKMLEEFSQVLSARL